MHHSTHRSFGWEKDSPAQGMVEFALVLPVLLLIIFGIIAFGHFFFNYSLVVAASRDAARFGAAVGLTENSLPRYRDCNMIRQAAAHSGGFAGIDGSNASVNITYDKGPKLDGSAAEEVKDALGVVIPCPVDGIGPGNIELGDRIVVTVTMNYRPIVPLVPMDDMPLTATTRRTIMLGMPVGELPIAEQSSCIGTLTRIVPPNWDNTLRGSVSRVGEVISFPYEVIADDPDATAQGMLYFYVNDVLYASPSCSDTAPIDQCMRSWNALTPLDKPHVLRAKYDPGTYATGTPCYDPSKAEPLRHYVIAADTITKILTVVPETAKVGDTVKVEVEVIPKPPGGGTPLGPVVISDKHGATCTVVLAELMLGVARGSCEMVVGTADPSDVITAVYDPGLPGLTPEYNSSSTTMPYPVGSGPAPATQCPAFASDIIDFSLGSSMILTLKNNNFIPVQIDGVTVSWPMDPPVNLMSVNYNGIEIWGSGVENFPPPIQPITPKLAASVTGDALSEPMQLDFSSALPTTGTYAVTISFGGGSPPVDCADISISVTR